MTTQFDSKGGSVTPGIHTHFKGGTYTVLFTARDSSNGPLEGQRMVVYISHQTGEICVRTLSEFCGTDEKTGKVRFQFTPGPEWVEAHKRNCDAG